MPSLRANPVEVLDLATVPEHLSPIRSIRQVMVVHRSISINIRVSRLLISYIIYSQGIPADRAIMVLIPQSQDEGDKKNSFRFLWIMYI